MDWFLYWLAPVILCLQRRALRWRVWDRGSGRHVAHLLSGKFCRSSATLILADYTWILEHRSISARRKYVYFIIWLIENSRCYISAVILDRYMYVLGVQCKYKQHNGIVNTPNIKLVGWYIRQTTKKLDQVHARICMFF